MYFVEVQNPCRCFIRSGMAERLEFESEEAARREAERMLERMQSGFCQKHEFALIERFGTFTILIKPRI